MNLRWSPQSGSLTRQHWMYTQALAAEDMAGYGPYDAACPVCGRPAVGATRCIPGSYFCAAGHEWVPGIDGRDGTSRGMGDVGADDPLFSVRSLARGCLVAGAMGGALGAAVARMGAVPVLGGLAAAWATLRLCREDR